MASTPAEQGQEQRLRRDDRARAERERLGEIAGRLVKDAPRERVAAQQSDERGHDAEAQRLEEEHLHDRAALGADQAQIGDRLAALGNGQQQRVEREQEPEQRADRCEERARLVARAQRLAQQSDVLVGRGDLQTPARERLQLSAHGGVCPGAACTRMRVTRPSRPASRCRSASGITATSAWESAPNASRPSTAETFSAVLARAAAATPSGPRAARARAGGGDVDRLRGRSGETDPAR